MAPKFLDFDTNLDEKTEDCFEFYSTRAHSDDDDKSDPSGESKFRQASTRKRKKKRLSFSERMKKQRTGTDANLYRSVKNVPQLFVLNRDRELFIVTSLILQLSVHMLRVTTGWGQSKCNNCHFCKAQRRNICVCVCFCGEGWVWWSSPTVTTQEFPLKTYQTSRKVIKTTKTLLKKTATKDIQHSS
jgi:hypothetical protein